MSSMISRDNDQYLIQFRHVNYFTCPGACITMQHLGFREISGYKSHIYSMENSSPTIQQPPNYHFLTPAKQNTVTKLSFAFSVLLLQLDNFFPNSIFAFHNESLKFPFFTGVFFQHRNIDDIFLSVKQYLHVHWIPSSQLIVTVLYSPWQCSDSFHLPQFAGSLRGMPLVYHCIRGGYQMFGMF